MKKDYAYALNNRAGAKFKLNDLKGCIEDCTKAIAIDPNYAYAYLNRGNAKELLRDEVGACEDWTKAANLGAEAASGYIGICQ